MILTTASRVQLVASLNGLNVTFSNNKGEKRILKHGKKKRGMFSLSALIKCFNFYLFIFTRYPNQTAVFTLLRNKLI